MRHTTVAGRVTLLAFGIVLAMLATVAPAGAHPEGPPHHAPHPPHATEVMNAFAADRQETTSAAASSSGATCDNGFAGIYPCSNVDLLSHLALPDIGGTQSNSEANDIWGWTDTTTGQEYAIIGRVFGTSFVDITDPANPVYLGELPTHGNFGSSWRDIKVYADHAFIVSEALNHGMQVFDLTQLSTMARSSLPVTFNETAHYSDNASAHNVVINEDSGFAYIVGASGRNSCNGGLHMVDISTPTSPTFAGCFSGDGYTHDAQCVIYNGPDAVHSGKEICVASNEDTVTIVDVTDKTSPVLLSRSGYAGAQYTHQGWLTEDQAHFLLDDELDEDTNGHNTRTYVWDVSDLDAPSLTGTFTNTTPAIDHNQYVKGDFTYQANYRAGLRILQLVDLTVPTLEEVAYFDIYPADDAAQFNGAWSTYPYFSSGLVIVSGIEQGLFVLRPTLPDTGGGGDSPPSVTITQPSDGATVSGTTTISADASDDVGVTAVDFYVDNTLIGSDADGTDGWTASWDTTAVADGDHTLSAVATDTAGQTGSDAVTVTVDNEPTASMHVGDLDGTGTSPVRGRWDATVRIAVHDSAHQAVEAATVEGTWSTGLTGTCTTGPDGSCETTVSQINGKSVTFTVDTLSHSTLTYDATSNHDPNGDSDGTTITITRP